MALSQARAHQLLDHIHGVATAPVAVTPIRCRLMTANGSATANGTEVVTGGGYTSGTGAPSVTWGAAGTPQAGRADTTTAVTVTNMPRTETIVGVELWDSSATPQRQEWGALTSSKQVNSGDTFSIASGAMTSALA